MAGGRPRIWDREEILKKLIEWAKKDDSINLCGFCGSILLDFETYCKFVRESEEFRQAHTTVKLILANRREQRHSEGLLAGKCFDLNARTYDLFAKEEHRDEKTFEAKLKSDTEKETSQEVLDGVTRTLQQISSIREQYGIDDSNSLPVK